MYASRSAVRMCRRPDCQGSATATLSFRYDTAEAILYSLIEEPHPSRWDLCTLHADALRVPRGWDHIDERDQVSTDVPTRPAMRSNRYAELSARLSQIAVDHAQPGSDPPAGHDGQDGPDGRDGPGGPRSPDETDWGGDVIIPGQLTMPLHDVGMPPDGGMSGTGADGGAYPGNVVPLIRPGGLLDPVT